jgi:hypothetical protein
MQMEPAAADDRQRAACRAAAWHGSPVADFVKSAVSLAHPQYGEALRDALMARTAGTILHVGFTWAADEELPGHDPNVRDTCRAPFWVLWW